MKDIVKLGGILFIITAVCAGLLGTVQQVTSPIIEQNSAAAEKAAVQSLLADAEDFKDVEVEAGAPVAKLFEGVKGDEVVGFVAKVEPNGYGGKVEILVGMDAEGNINGINILNHSETPGYGANATKPQFLDQFKNRKTPLKLVKTASGEEDIEGLTGATITSTAVVTGVNDASDYVKQKEAK